MTDIPSTVPGQEYGKQAEQQRSLNMVPAGPQPTAGLSRQPPPSLTAPSGRPNEPVQAGLASGPGPGPEALGPRSDAQTTRETLQALMRKYPSPTIRRMLMDMEIR